MVQHRRRPGGHSGRTDQGPRDLPDLEAGVQLLSADDTDIRPPLHALAIDHVLLAGASGESTALWVDTGRHAQTTSLQQLAPSSRLLDRIHVARGFTAHQHHALIKEAIERIDQTTVLLVVPAIDAPYRDVDKPREAATEMLTRTLAHLSRAARQYNIPVLVSRRRDDTLSAPVAELATTEISYQETRAGPRFDGADHETLVYDVGNGWVQTTIAFWNQVLETRRPLYASADADVPSLNA
jgi:hypothetical protein